MLKKFFNNNHDLVLVGGVIAILLILFSPIPAVLLDLLIISNFAFAMMVLLMTFYVDKPVSFSTFPSLLLVGTLYRLALNVAATRLILTDGHAGQVIGAIGAFAVQGSFVIGLVVFFILVIVQYVVVTSGAQRVSEVAARFVLDAVPGQQMSIDADLNMGLIDQDEAKRRRKAIEKEAAFYGAMDGASKFVKGDAIAGIIILLINIIAGWIIGVAQMGMDWMTALQTFSLLTIGDGIVTQVPALIISTATGIIVTRSSADRQLSAEIMAQLASVRKIPLIVMGALLILMLLPGMPKWPIAILALLAAAMWLSSSRKKAQSPEKETATDEDAGRESGKSAAPPVVQVTLGRDLGLHWSAIKPLLSERIEALRTQQEAVSGFAFPPLTFQDNAKLGANDYEVLIYGARYAQGRLYPDKTLAIQTSAATAALPGLQTRDPAFGLPAVWIEQDQRDLAERSGYTLVDPITALMTHLGEVLRSEAAQLLSRAHVTIMLEGVRNRQPGVIEELIPSIITVTDVQRVLQNLLSENVSIRNIDLIVDALVDVGRHTKDHGDLTEAVRQKLNHGICHDLRGNSDQLAVLSLNPRLEAQITDGIRRSDGRTGFVIEPRLAEQLLLKLMPQADTMIQQGLAPVLLCGPEIRRHLKTFTRRTIPRLAVVSVNEVPSSIDLKSFDVVSVE
ncbi:MULTISPECIES: flagellar biosynthesis protein FlhA [Asticcacaulis]|uniref:flagellar biosynthesis protein FlhA n=1 Tax=Asticcacaulis TaxID=76890 RepID=UPI001AEA5FF8|nr:MULTISPECIES: flagellar biosynthesis protein FlhA [Asticcacaulis]MBP2161162.1 flagellar biosynthesis protein FlhA [Asticcacaulis solisilvae]MDR6802207.1 flagellar biosynthesis protein FlhA [Asticcacaulis sp. BE141]